MLLPNFAFDVIYVMTSIKGHESTLYEALLVIAGLLFNFTIVKMRGPNKSLKRIIQ